MRAFTRRPIEREPLRTSALPRTDSPSVHPCPPSGSASGFFLASALSFHEALRPPGTEDARRVRPTSATRTNDVHPFAPYVPGSLESLSRLGTPRDDLWSSRCMTEGTSVFTTPEPLRPHLRWRSLEREPPYLRPRGFWLRAWACSTHDARWDEVSDTPVATPSFSPRSRAFARARFFDSTYGPLCFRGARVGRESEEAAETTVTNGS